MAALKRYRDVFDPTTTSVILVSSNQFDPTRGVFRGLEGRLEEREELRRRMLERIAPRERKLLFLWYVADLRPAGVARALGISRMHCYRLRKVALDALSDLDEEAAS